MVTLEDVKRNKEVETYLKKENEYLGALGYTEHGFRHATMVSQVASNILVKLNYPAREVELAAIAGYMHDIGNVISRHDHGQSGGLIAFRILEKMGMEPEEIAIIVGAIGNHEEEYGQPISPVSAALILADKSDVHRSRVRNKDFTTFDIHDRVNYAVQNSFLQVNSNEQRIVLNLSIDKEISSVMDYFEIFMTRMLMCRRACTFLGWHFGIVINENQLL